MSQQHPTRYLRQSPFVVPNGLRVAPTPSTRPRPTHPRNKFEAAVLKIPQSLKLPDGFFPTDAEIDAELDEIDAIIEKESGKKKSYHPYRREDRRACYHQTWDAIFTAANRDTIQIWGLKPQKGDLVHTTPIPGSGLAVRLWDTGLDDLSECCLDFIDCMSLKAVNSPKNWQLFPASHLGVGRVPIPSREEVDGYKKADIPPGEERFDIMRARCYAIRRPGYPDFLFEVPMKNIVVGAVQARESRAG